MADPNSCDEHVAGVRERFNDWSARVIAERDLTDDRLAALIEESE